MIVSFDVHGTPKPQGSKKAILAGRHAVLKESGGNEFAAWRNAVADASQRAAKDVGRFDGPVKVSVHFRFPMPKSRPAVARRRGWCWRTVAPDVDHLERALFDGLVAGGLLADDALIVHADCTKTEEATGWHGATITILSLT